MLWQVSRRQAVGRRSLALTGAGMAAYALATGVVASKGPILSRGLDQSGNVFAFHGPSIQLVRGMIAYEMAAAIWVIPRPCAGPPWRRKQRPSRRPGMDVVLPIFTAVLLVGWGITESLSRLERGISLKALSIWSQTTARSIDPAYFRSEWDPRHEESDDYRRLKAALSWAGQTDWDVRGSLCSDTGRASSFSFWMRTPRTQRPLGRAGETPLTVPTSRRWPRSGPARTASCGLCRNRTGTCFWRFAHFAIPANPDASWAFSSWNGNRGLA